MSEQSWNPAAPAPGVYRGVDIDLYHRSAGIGSSGLNTCLRKSPAHYRYERDNPPVHDYLDEGNVADVTLLEPESAWRKIHVVDAEDWRTKAAQQERDAARAKGSYVVTRKAMARIGEYVEALKTAHTRFGITPDPYALLRAGEAQVSFVAVDAATGLTVRARTDSVLFDQRLIIDLKTDHDASPRGFQRKAYELGYGMRAFSYRETVAAALNEDPNDWQFLWLVVEKTAPFPVALYAATPAMLAHGEREYRKGMSLVASCMETGLWPGYSTGIEPLDPPDWVLRDLPRSA